MIVTAKYVGPFPEVTCNGTTAKPGEIVRLRIPDGQTLAGCWEVQTDADAPADEMVNGTPEAAAATAKKKGA
jgi:hypothetical protein